jgi:transcriptional regulator with XRE-family HTH domain
MEKIKYARDRKRFGKYIRELRGGMTLREAGEHLKMPFGMIACIERGEPVKISMDFLYSAAEVFGVNADDICEQAQRIPRDVYYKVADNRALWEVIRNG